MPVRVFIAVALLALAAGLLLRPASAEEVRPDSRPPSTGPAAPSAAPPAAPDPHKAELQAATIDARELLRQSILSYGLAPGVNVRQFLERTTGGDEVTPLVQNAGQRGGPRWISDQTCEVILEVPGSDLAPVLRKILDDNKGTPSKLPAPRDQIEQRLKALDSHTFTAMGKSTGCNNLVRLRPAAWATAWQNVSDADRREAILTARNNAVERVVQSLRPVPAGAGKTLDEAMNTPEVSDEVRDWLRNRPVTDVVFGNDQEVRLTLSSPSQELWPVLESAMRRHHLGPPGDDAKAWAALRDAFLRTAAPAVGRGVAAAKPPANAANPAVPADPPPWVAQRATASSTAHADKAGWLMATHDARTEALNRVRAQVNALTLNGKVTLGEAARTNPRIARALETAMGRASAPQINYLPNKMVKVTVSLDLQEVWEALNAQR